MPPPPATHFNCFHICSVRSRPSDAGVTQVACRSVAEMLAELELCPSARPARKALLIDTDRAIKIQIKQEFNTLRTGDADLRFYITTSQDG